MQIRHISIQNFRGIKQLDWHITSSTVCIIGKGDSCKSTLLDAIELGLSPNPATSVDDSDFYNMDVRQPVSIQISIGGFGESKDLERLLLSDTNYGLYVRGYKDKKIHNEPDDDYERILTIEFWVDEELEPQWRVIAPDRQEPKIMRKAHLERLGTAKLGSYADWHFSWSKNSMISRMLGKDVRDINSALATIGRKAREDDINLAVFETQAKELQDIVKDFGVGVTNYAPKLDIQALTVKSGGLSLHDDGVPIKRFGTGTKRLIALAIQKKLNEGKSIRLIDEIEYGLEPYRITQAMKKIHSNDGQTFVTTHSPTVLREASLENITVFHAQQGTIKAVSLSEGLSEEAASSLQGTLRTHADSFLSERIIVCEGATEIGLARALDKYRDSKSKPVFAAHGIALLDANGSSKCAPVAEKLASTGYSVAILCDSDVALTMSEADLNAKGVQVYQWSSSRCTEQAIFEDLASETLVDLIAIAIRSKNKLDVYSQVKARGISSLDDNPANWDWADSTFRSNVGVAASTGKWFKTVRYGEEMGDTIFSHFDKANKNSNCSDVMKKLDSWCD